MPMCVFIGGGIPPSVMAARRAELEERRSSALRNAEQLRKEMETNAALREKMQLEARRKLEAQRDYAFQQMEDRELHRIYSVGSILRQIAAHKRFWAWRKQAVLELQQLRENERLGRETLAQGTDTFIPAVEKVTWDHTDTGESRVSITFSDPTDITNILPITTPAEFALKQQHTPDPGPLSRSGTEGMASCLGLPPGKRISFREMPQIRCNPEHYHWLRQSVSVTLVKGSSRKGSRLWTQVASLMWIDGIAAGQTAGNDDSA